jgi:sugar lactone lactonase YvrE
MLRDIRSVNENERERPATSSAKNASRDDLLGGRRENPRCYTSTIRTIVVVAAALLILSTDGALAQRPRIDSVTPARGPIEGGTVVTIRGAHLGGAEVRIDASPIRPSLQTDDEIRLQMPARDSGYAVLSARTSEGAGYGEYFYEPPALDTIAPGAITTVAGAGSFAGDGRLATAAMIDPTHLAFDGEDLYILEAAASRIRRVRSDGRIETFAGTGVDGFTADGGDVSLSSLWNPRGMALDATSVIIAESFSHRVRRIDKRTGIITTIAGRDQPNPLGGFSGDGGPARQAELSFPSQVTLDGSGNLYILDSGNQRVRVVSPQGTIHTVAGNGTIGDGGDGGPALQASFSFTFVDLGGLAVDREGNLFIADSQNHRIRRVDAKTGIIKTFANATNVRGIAAAGTDLIYARIDLAAPNEPKIFRVDAEGRVLESYGSATGFSEDGTPANTAAFGFIERVVLDPAGNLAYTDASASRVRRIVRSTGLLETLAGMGPALIGENGHGSEAILRNYNAALAARGDEVIIGDGTIRLRALDRRGIIRTIAGKGLFALPPVEDVPAISAPEVTAIGMAVTSAGELIFTDTHALWKIDHEGMLRRVAGRPGRHGLAGDGGPALDASMVQPWDVAIAGDGSLLVADSNNNRIRRIAGGIITTVAGSGPSNGFEQYGRGSTCGDGGPASAACLNTPYGVAVDAGGNLYVSENWERIRKITTDGRIDTFAQIYATKLTFDSVGRLYAVSGDGVVRILPDGRIERLAGAPGRHFPVNDGMPALSASVFAQGQASGIVIDDEGHLYFNDGGHLRVRAIRFGAVLAPAGAMLAVTARGQTIEARVSDRDGRPAPGVRVDFQAPSSGASCRLSRPFALTGADGLASVECAPSCARGSYVVNAQAVGSVEMRSVAFTNETGSCRRRAVRP